MNWHYEKSKQPLHIKAQYRRLRQENWQINGIDSSYLKIYGKSSPKELPMCSQVTGDCVSIRTACAERKRKDCTQKLRRNIVI